MGKSANNRLASQQVHLQVVMPEPGVEPAQERRGDHG